jgi:hypothetical protein
VNKVNDKLLENMAKTVNVDTATLRSRAETVLSEQGGAWLASGKTQDVIDTLAIRVATRMINTENSRLKRSGATVFEGMFIDMSRPKMWGEWGYNKMKAQLMSANESVRDALVASGGVVLYEDNHDGSYTKHCREDFGGDEQDFGELPRGTMRLDENTHFYCVWDKSNPTFPSGDANFKFGKPRPQDDRERISLFLGRAKGTNSDPQVFTVRAQGKAADVQHPTFLTGTIPLRAGNNNNAYAKPDLSIFSADESVTEIFSAPPQELIGSLGIYDSLPDLASLETYYESNFGKDGWYNKKQSVVAEVIHIDPRDNGGLVMMCADLDMTSTANPIDVYISADEESQIDFGVGSKLLLVGETWKTQEEEYRLNVNGWFAFDKVEAMALPSSSEDSWDGDNQ